jgi:putative oxidoreductase
MKQFFHDFALLLLRLGFGGSMAMLHGWGKLESFSEKSGSFPDPLGVGASISLALTVGAEFGAGLMIAVGLFTRLASAPIAFTMAMACFVIHAGDPMAKRELSFLYLIGFVVIALLGAGKFSLDRAVRKV